VSGLVHLEFGCRVTIGMIFLISSTGKAGSPTRFAAFLAEIADLRLVPPGWGRIVGASVCVAEVCVVGLLLSPGTTVVGFVAGSALLGVFSAAVVHSVRAGLGARCQCFGFRSGRLGKRHVYRNSLLLTVCAAGTVAAIARVDRAPAWVDLLPTTLLALVVVSLVVFMDDLVDLLRVPPAPDRGRW